MSISLQKNQTINLQKPDTSPVVRFTMGLGWDAASSGGGFFKKLLGAGSAGSIDLDASCILFDANKKPLDVIWFQQLKSRCCAVLHSGDNRTGEGDGDDESITVMTNKLRPEVKHMVFTVNSFTGQNFDQVENAYCRILDDSNKEIAKFNLSEKGSHTGLVMASVSRDGSGWKVTAHGTEGSGRTAGELTKKAADMLP